ncbi:MAG: T9SS type A sorting domain-containing protein, partial [Bacteroidales bacterium]|nr:T9SS type A sorting domain-containing protein [Bacteroidales bacterium]
DCEISNVNLQTLTNVSYTDGHVYQETPLGVVMMDSLTTHTGAELVMPVTIEGAGFDSVTQTHLRIAYDTAILEYSSFTEIAISGIALENTNGILTIDWMDTLNPMDFTSLDTLFNLNYGVTGDTITTIDFLPGCKVYNNKVLVTSAYEHGYVDFEYYLDLAAEPVVAGTTNGSGYYMPQAGVNVSTTPEPGYSFEKWTIDDSIVSSDPAFLFSMPAYDVLLTANYTAIDYTLTVLASPEEAGQVSGGGTYNVNDTANLNAIPDEGYQFDYWHNGDSIVSYNPEYSFIMPPHDDTMTAFFSVIIYNVGVQPNNPEWGTTTGGGEYEYGDTATVVATPEEGYKFIVWTEDGEAVSYDSAFSFEVFDDHNLMAHFLEIIDCSMPVALSAGNITLTSAALYWVPSGDEVEWEILWDTAGFDTTNQGNLVTGIFETTYLLEGLDSGTLYDFYVRAVCNDTLSSNWAGPETFNTLYVNIESNASGNQFVLYPNPVSGYLNIKGLSKQNKIQNLQVMNTHGQVMQQFGPLDCDDCQIDLNFLKPGLYFLRFTMDDKSATLRKIILK